jgi:hypothetical protein
MQDSEKKRLETMVKTNDSKAKRTTIILDTNERAFINSLIIEEKEPGIKQLISKMLKIYKKLMIQDWRFPGEYYSGISRIAFVNVELIDIILNKIPKENWIDLGNEIGRALKVSMETTLDIQANQPKNWNQVFNRLSIQGFGDFYLKDKYILIKIPFINYSSLWKGILEGLLEVRLDMKTTIPPLVFQVMGKTISLKQK